MKKIDKHKRVCMIFTEDIIKGFDELIKETGASFSELIRRASIEYLERHKKNFNDKQI
jgi:metal-responsive CopG/Arc/MetJ family transcriptional regulator